MVGPPRSLESGPMALAGLTDQDWERLWAPYDEHTYRQVLSYIQPDDVVLEIGAGDLRLAYRLAAKAKRVYAIEINQALLSVARSRPNNLQAICADAYTLAIPKGVTVATLLMRHCLHFGLLAEKLASANCWRLVTNGRWRMGVELVDLAAPRVPFGSLSLGWYACWCGATGFVAGSPERLTPELEAVVHEVRGCPACHRAL